VKKLLLLIAVVITLLCLYHMYAEYRSSKLVPPEVRSSDDYKLAVEEAVADARQLRSVELAGGVIIFTLVGFFMAALRLRPAWLRTLLAAFSAWLVTLVVFAMRMETIFHNSNEKVQGTSMPFPAYETAIVYAGAGVMVAIIVYFIIERIHVWRVGQ